MHHFPLVHCAVNRRWMTKWSVLRKQRRPNSRPGILTLEPSQEAQISSGKDFRKGCVLIPNSGLCTHLQMNNFYNILTLLSYLFSKSILTLVTTTWPKLKWRINSYHRPQRRRLRSQGDTSQHLRTCLKEKLQLWQANWLADGFMFTVLLPFQTPLHIYLPFTFLFSFSPLYVFSENK